MSEGKGAAVPRVLEDVVACILGVSNAKAAITARIDKHGGRVAARLGKDVSHIVWERRHSRRPSDKAADEAELLELFHKLEKVGSAAPLADVQSLGTTSSHQPATAACAELPCAALYPRRWTTHRWWCRRCGWRSLSRRGAAWWSASTW